MSLHAQEVPPVPEETRRVAHAAFPRGNVYMRRRDELGAIYHDHLTFSVLAYTAFRQQRFLAGGSWSGLAAATRPPGILLGMPLLFAAVSYLKDHRRWGPVIGAGLSAVSGLLAFLFYLWTAFGDPLATFRVQQQAPGWQRAFALPFRSIQAGLK